MYEISKLIGITTTVLLIGVSGVFGQVQTGNQYRFLDGEYESARFVTQTQDSIKAADVVALLGKLEKRYPGDFHYEIASYSVEGRPIHLVSLGTGDTKILLWSQMHGDEPTATAALFDVFNYLMSNIDNEFVRTILDEITIYAVPMLNPDGAEIHKRRNAQGLDINRDARDLQSPEGKLLYRLQSELRPEFGFNLHNQDKRNSVGDTDKLAAIALMAPPFDYNLTDNPVRIRAKKIVSHIYQTLGPYLYGHVSKYDADYMPRSFGDSMQSWGISTVLIESGGWYQNTETYLQKMNFIALISSFHAIATENYMQANPAIYDLLDENGRDLFDLLIQDITVIDGTGIPAFTTDIAVNYSLDRGVIADLGDLNIYASRDTVQGDGLILVPGLIGVAGLDTAVDSTELANRANAMLKKGFTTLILDVPQAAVGQVGTLFEGFKSGSAVKIRIALRPGAPLLTATDTLGLIKAVKTPLTGVISNEIEPDGSLARLLAKPIVREDQVNSSRKLKSINPETVSKLTLEQATQWRLSNIGKIRKGYAADFVLMKKGVLGKPKIEAVYISGHRVWSAAD